jgi:hypothetical protein
LYYGRFRGKCGAGTRPEDFFTRQITNLLIFVSSVAANTAEHFAALLISFLEHVELATFINGAPNDLG